MRTVELSVVNGGIQRLRTKGGASPKSLYDLVNGYVTADKRIQSRPGTFRVAELPTNSVAGTVGLTAFGGLLHVFANDFIEDIPDGFELHIIRHPQINDSAGDPIPLKRIHFAEPFLGFLYVVAEFTVTESDLESVYHYWIQTGSEWQSSTWYPLGSIVVPTDSAFLAYQSTRLASPFPSWAAGALRTEGEVIEPTVYNDFYFTATSVSGTNPVSGQVEPTWPEESGATVIEESEGENTIQTGPTITIPSTTQQPNPVTKDRYNGRVPTFRTP